MPDVLPYVLTGILNEYARRKELENFQNLLKEALSVSQPITPPMPQRKEQTIPTQDFITDILKQQAQKQAQFQNVINKILTSPTFYNLSPEKQQFLINYLNAQQPQQVDWSKLYELQMKYTQPQVLKEGEALVSPTGQELIRYPKAITLKPGEKVIRDDGTVISDNPERALVYNEKNNTYAVIDKQTGQKVLQGFLPTPMALGIQEYARVNNINIEDLTLEDVENAKEWLKIMGYLPSNVKEVKTEDRIVFVETDENGVPITDENGRPKIIAEVVDEFKRQKYEEEKKRQEIELQLKKEGLELKRKLGEKELGLKEKELGETIRHHKALEGISKEKIEKKETREKKPYEVKIPIAKTDMQTRRAFAKWLDTINTEKQKRQKQGSVYTREEAIEKGRKNLFDPELYIESSKILDELPSKSSLPTTTQPQKRTIKEYKIGDYTFTIKEK